MFRWNFFSATRCRDSPPPQTIVFCNRSHPGGRFVGKRIWTRRAVFGDNMEMSLGIAEETIARRPPEAQAIIRLLPAKIAELESRIEELHRQGKGKTQQNSSLLPARNIPTPGRNRLNASRRRNAAGSPATISTSAPGFLRTNATTCNR
ncbi:MAG: hypothetical protein ACUVS7_17135 [Bryobacteraceae bacterium]